MTDTTDSRNQSGENVIGRNGEVRPAHDIITREVQLAAVDWHSNGYEGFYEIADMAAIAIEELVDASDVDGNHGRHWLLEGAE